MTNKFLTVTVGISNSGKTSWAEAIAESDKQVVNINRDDLRIKLFCEGEISKLSTYKMSKHKEQQVTKEVQALMEKAVQDDKHIIISDTNLNPLYRQRFKDFAKSNGYTYTEQVFDVPVHVCKARNLKREYTVPPSVIDRQYVAMRHYLGFKTYTGTPNKPKAVIFDVDGTLADMRGLRKPYEWNLVSLDRPRKNVMHLAEMLAAKGYSIVVLSGRDGCCYDDTYKWLQQHLSHFDVLHMRKPKDSRPDATIKEELFWKFVAPHYDVQYVVDDRNQMVSQWRSMGLECWQVQDGDF